MKAISPRSSIDFRIFQVNETKEQKTLSIRFSPKKYGKHSSGLEKVTAVVISPDRQIG